MYKKKYRPAVAKIFVDFLYCGNFEGLLRSV
jgi:hypothetical protein